MVSQILQRHVSALHNSSSPSRAAAHNTPQQQQQQQQPWGFAMQPDAAVFTLPAPIAEEAACDETGSADEIVTVLFPDGADAAAEEESVLPPLPSSLVRGARGSKSAHGGCALTCSHAAAAVAADRAQDARPRDRPRGRAPPPPLRAALHLLRVLLLLLVAGVSAQGRCAASAARVKAKASGCPSAPPQVVIYASHSNRITACA
jgi:hypothetical protein